MKNADENLVHPVIIIGAGVCGLIAQSVFQAHGIDSLIIEKGRGLGGRCATRRGVHFIADHGPQFFNSRILASPFLNRENQDSIKSIQLTADSKNPRLIYPKGMSQLARLVSVRPEVLREERVVQVLRSDKTVTSQYYELICESKKTFKAKNLILTPPLPQSLVLIENLSFEATQQPKLRTLRAIGYDRCITLILELAEPIEIGNDGIWKNCSEAVSGIYNQQEKGLESELPTLVVHASPELSLRLWDQENSQIEKSILAETLSCLDRRQIAFEVSKIHLHRWKYAEPKALYPEPYALLGQPQHECAVAGDAFQRASLGGAVASGEALALAMIKQGL